MEKLIINGGKQLRGRVKISGAKNAVLPIIAAALLGQDSPSKLEEVPALDDVHTLSAVLEQLGVKVEFDADKNTLLVDSSEITTVRLLMIWCGRCGLPSLLLAQCWLAAAG